MADPNAFGVPVGSYCRRESIGPDYLVGDAATTVVVSAAEHDHAEPLERDGDQVIRVRRRDTAGEASEEAFCVFG
jgi:hypothetical protein